MALIRIKQINNSVATEGALIAFDGTSNVWTNNDTGAILVSSGTTGERPSSPVNGFIRYNTTTNKLEMFQNGSWTNLDSASIIVEDDTVNVVSSVATLNFGTNLVVTDDGGGDVTIDASSNPLTTVTTFAGLPATPATNDLIFYTPFNAVMTFDGVDWCGPKITSPIFGREGTGNGDVYLHTIGRSDGFPQGGLTHGYVMPNIVSGSGGTSQYKFSVITGACVNAITGDLELHVNATTNTPTFASTGVILATFTAQRQVTEESTPSQLISGGDVIQCFWNRTSGTWKDWTATMTYCIVAGA